MTLRSHLATSSKTRRGYHKRRSINGAQLTSSFNTMARATPESSTSSDNIDSDATVATEEAGITMEDVPPPSRRFSSLRRSNSQRRSSFLGLSMRKERTMHHETGEYDSNGEPTYIVRVSEAQGFKWNPLLTDVFDELDFE
ncbi:hypothetical protein B9G98_00733 [Wickerhamiella sorbophila]|uniref:Uncharacterized protein n=1 Tax=Wickerhamiella sorbophila TaxID=45607 RepID=A0A2T0FDN1_9ASCO|nr:hypothetical protein B9G98_00733 [Wickerhamiella sorbophila]PRT53113.1 hypothetical protein B9G98_00733 [Wickerhamiella sorbophila]